jgi:hypothetical protein
MAMISIGGVALPNPTDYKVILQDLDSDNTTRSETGFLTRDRVRAGIYKIDVTWQVKRPLLKLITDQLETAKFTVTFFDPTDSADHTAQMYCGDRSGTLKSYTDESKPDESLWELSLQLIEF